MQVHHSRFLHLSIKLRKDWFKSLDFLVYIIKLQEGTIILQISKILDNNQRQVLAFSACFIKSTLNNEKLLQVSNK